jgi:hypothetical protein
LAAAKQRRLRALARGDHQAEIPSPGPCFRLLAHYLMIGARRPHWRWLYKRLELCLSCAAESSVRRTAMRRFLILALFLSVPASAAETITYVYDARGRLKQVIRTGTVNNGVTTTYAIDKADNRTNKTTTGSPNPPPP